MPLRWQQTLPILSGVSLTPAPLAKEGFNIAYHVDDEPNHVRANRALLQVCAAPNRQWLWLSQTHSATVIDDSSYQPKIEGDAIITAQKDRVAVVMTADCVPILLYTSGKVAAIHAGWPALYSGIIANTLCALNTPMHEVFATIAPCALGCCYEVDEGLYQRFVRQNPAYQTFFTPTSVGHYHFDLADMAQYQLMQQGVPLDNIAQSRLCTICDTRFFSHRRTGKAAGRIASFIALA